MTILIILLLGILIGLALLGVLFLVMVYGSR